MTTTLPLIPILIPIPPSLVTCPKQSLEAFRKGGNLDFPSLSVGCIPGTGDSDPEDELKVVEGDSERRNRIWEKKYGMVAKRLSNGGKRRRKRRK